MARGEMLTTSGLPRTPGKRPSLLQLRTNWESSAWPSTAVPIAPLSSHPVKRPSRLRQASQFTKGSTCTAHRTASLGLHYLSIIISYIKAGRDLALPVSDSVRHWISLSEAPRSLGFVCKLLSSLESFLKKVPCTTDICYFAGEDAEAPRGPNQINCSQELVPIKTYIDT